MQQIQSFASLVTRSNTNQTTECLKKIDEALVVDDGEDGTNKLTEGKDWLVERNKHILLAEK